MSGTLVCLVDFLATRGACPVCGAGRVNSRDEYRAVFTCEAVFFANEPARRIFCHSPCETGSVRAAELWTIEAGGPSRPAVPAPQDEASVAALPASRDEGDGA